MRSDSYSDAILSKYSSRVNDDDVIYLDDVSAAANNNLPHQCSENGAPGGFGGGGREGRRRREGKRIYKSPQNSLRRHRNIVHGQPSQLHGIDSQYLVSRKRSWPLLC